MASITEHIKAGVVVAAVGILVAEIAVDLAELSTCPLRADAAATLLAVLATGAGRFTASAAAAHPITDGNGLA